MKDTAEGLMAFVDDSEYAAVHLEQLLEMRFSKKTGNEAAYSALVINELGDQKKLVLVREIQSVRDIIIKPFSYYLPKVIGMVGATILGNGDIASVIDVTDLLPKYSSNLSSVNSEVGSDLEEIHQASVLVVEDSISTRRSLAEFMQGFKL